MRAAEPTLNPAQDLAAGHRSPYLSIVACSRNDGHGENLVDRMQLFVDGIAEQAERFRLDCELILVDWNPPVGKPGLAEVLSYPAAGGYLSSRVVVVPPALHATLPHSEALPLFQMIAKNVGIRRARGRMVLSTNIDILFPDTLMAWLASGEVDERALYRADRADITVPFGSPEAVSPTAMRALQPLRVNRRDGVYDSRGNRIVPMYTSLADLARYRSRLYLRRDLPREVKPANPLGTSRGTLRGAVSVLRKLWRLLSVPKPHLVACGDFTLMSGENWERVGGHAEWPMYSWNLDALLLYQSRARGIREVDLDARFSVFHMDHSKGSGWTPEGAGDLFARMEARGVPVYTNAMLVAEARRLGVTAFHRPSPRRYGGATWGYCDVAFEEPPI